MRQTLVIVALLVGNGIVEVRPAPVEAVAELQRLRRQHEPIAPNLLALPVDRLPRAPTLHAAMVVMVVREHHVIDIYIFRSLNSYLARASVHPNNLLRSQCNSGSLFTGYCILSVTVELYNHLST